MHRACFCIGAVLLAALPAWAGSPDAPALLEPHELAARIDQQFAARWQAIGLTPAEQADDASYLRRISLDVAGKTPTVIQVRRFLADSATDKRDKMVEDLLDSPGYVHHFASVWRTAWLPEAESNFQSRFAIVGFDAWLRQKLTDNVPYDQMVREVLTTPVGSGRNGAFQRAREATPYGFYFAKDMKPENLSSATARFFLGVRLECAQCHDHPFAKWKRDQFWNMTAFFAGIQAKSQEGFIQQVRDVPDRRELAIPGTDRVAQAMFLDNSVPQWKPNVDARSTLADWVTSPDNTAFSRAVTNRFWAHFFGKGIVDPFDDFKDNNPPSHPEVLDELARQFVLHKFDLKYLVRTITATKAYQLSSAGPELSPDERLLFARMPLRGLSPEQLFESFVQATGYKDPTSLRSRPYAFNSLRTEFLSKFDRTEKKTEMATSIPQALAVMNSRLVTDAVSFEKGELLPAVADAPFLDTVGKIEVLYLAALARKPRSDELAKLVPYVDEGGPKKDSRRALTDVMWALLNSSEFILNH